MTGVIKTVKWVLRHHKCFYYTVAYCAFHYVTHLRHSADCCVSSECINADRATFSPLLLLKPQPDDATFAQFHHNKVLKNIRSCGKMRHFQSLQSMQTPRGTERYSHVRLPAAYSQGLSFTHTLIGWRHIEWEWGRAGQGIGPCRQS